MINIKHKQQPGAMSIEISGHANYADSGNDIICASVSILFFALVDTVADMPEMDKNIKINEKEGSSLVELSHGSENAFKTAKIAFDTIANGLGILAINYPGYVHIENI